eukprot:298322_1
MAHYLVQDVYIRIRTGCNHIRESYHCVNMYDSIKSLKEMISTKMGYGYAVEDQILLYGGQVLNDNQTVDDYGLQKFDVITVQTKEQLRFQDKLQQVGNMKRSLRKAFFTPTDETFMDIMDTDNDNPDGVRLLGNWLEENEFDTDALYDDINEAGEWVLDSNIHQFCVSKTNNLKILHSLRSHVITHHQQNHNEIDLDYNEQNENYRYKTRSKGRERFRERFDQRRDFKMWDEDLNDGINSMMDGDERKVFDDIFMQYKSSAEVKLHQHMELRQHIHGLLKEHDLFDGKIRIRQVVLDMLKKRENEISEQHQSRVYYMNKQQKQLDESWRRSVASTTSLENIKKEMAHRREYAQIERQRLELEFYKQIQKVKELREIQFNHLADCGNLKDIERWYQKFEDLDMREGKNDVLVELIENKIKATHSKIMFGKYLQNSPFADDVQREAIAA